MGDNKQIDTKKYNQQPNIITNSRQEFTLIEKRILYHVINQMETGFNIQTDLFKNTEFVLPVALLGPSTNYKQVKHSIEKLNERKIKLINDRNESIDIITPFPRVQYKDGIVKITMFADVVKHFIELKHGYTKYQLEIALSLTSVYSQRFYELLSRWKDTGKWINVEVLYLKTLLGIENEYKLLGHFKNRVLDTAQRELLEKTDISFEYKLKKTGRAYTHIDFHIKYNSVKKLASEFLDAKEETEQASRLPAGELYVFIIQELKHYNLSRKEEEQILADPLLRDKFIDLNARIANNAVEIKRADGNPTPIMKTHLWGKAKK